jgi:diacylglycerol O-acyltransferase
MHFIERGKGAVLLSRIHHCVGDGVALIGLLLGVSDQEREMPVQEVGLETSHPHGVMQTAREVALQGATLARLLALWPDPPSALRGELGARKQLVYSRPIPLGELKAIAAAHGCKVNDVLVAAVSGALRRHLARHGGVPRRDPRAMVPVYLRGRARAGDLGNHFGLVFLDLPVGRADADERLRVARARMDKIKHAPDAIVSLEVLGAMGLARPVMEDVAIELFTSKASIMFTNVAGPPELVHLAGKPLSSMVVWAPVSGRLALGVSALSYAGVMHVAFKADARRIAEPAALLTDLDAELDALRVQPLRSAG